MDSGKSSFDLHTGTVAQTHLHTNKLNKNCKMKSRLRVSLCCGVGVFHEGSEIVLELYSSVALEMN